jgi:signal transduction histidine kinase
MATARPPAALGGDQTGSRADGPVRAGQRRGLLLAALLCLLVTTGCGQPVSPQAATADAGAAALRTELAGLLIDLTNAAEAVEAALEAAGDAPAARFDALEAVRHRFHVDGVVWNSPGGDDIWAGRPLSRRRLPAHPPWERTFQAGVVRYHQGPFVRGLQVGPIKALGGHAYASIVLEERHPRDDAAAPFEARWLRPLGLREVSISQPRSGAEDTGPGEPDPARRRFTVTTPAGVDALDVELRAPGAAALAERNVTTRDRTFGIFGLLLLSLLAFGIAGLIRRRVSIAHVRWLLFGVLALAGRHALLLLDLGKRFPEWRRGFSPERFALDTPLGWFTSPADFAISGIALLVFSACLRKGAHLLPRLDGTRYARWFVAVAAPLAAAVIAGLWLLLIERAVFAGQNTYFDASSLVPALTDALMLAGLVALTGTAYLLTAFVLEQAFLAFPNASRTTRRLLLGVASVGLTALLSVSVGAADVAALGLPLAAILLIERGGVGDLIALPSRILLLTVLATALLFPVLWTHLQTREHRNLPEKLEQMLRHEDATEAALQLKLLEWSENDMLRASMSRALDGPRPEGLAMALWFLGPFHDSGDPGRVSVLDPEGRVIDEFLFGAVPSELLPPPRPLPAEGPDQAVRIARGDPGLRCTVGRMRVTDANGRVLGGLVVTVPDRLDLHLFGLAEASAPSARGDDARSPLTANLDVAILRGDRILRANANDVSRAPGGFGPPGLAGIPDERQELRWREEAHDGYARWVPSRGVSVAIRRTLPGGADRLLGIARLLVVGVGIGALVALLFALAALPGFRPRLHHKILLSYFAISVVPLVLLGFSSTRETERRFEEQLESRLERDLTRVREAIQRQGPAISDVGQRWLVRWAADGRHDVLLYRGGVLEASSRPGLAASELLPARLPPDVYRATALESRQVIRREALHAGRQAWVGYAPVIDDSGRPRATVAVPLIYEADQIEAAVSVTGSALLAGYLLALVLVLVAGIFAARNLTAPLGELARGTRRVASGELDLALPGEGTDEFGQLVSSFNQMTRELREASEKAAQAEREVAWRRMARQVAHEIRNPLTPMRLMIQQMEAAVARDPEAAQQIIKDTAPVVLRQIEALQRIAGDFANFARLPKRNLVDVDVAELIQQVTALHAGAKRHDVTVETEITPPLPTVQWDEGEIRRVLLNLLSNAAHAVRAEGHVVVRARAASLDGVAGVSIAVQDTGVGISPEHQARLFDPQFSTRSSGTGLGLAIVARIIQDMGGRIDVASAVGAGSTFTLWMPSVQAAGDAI